MVEGFGISNRIACRWFTEGVNFEIICEGLKKIVSQFVN